MYKPSDLKGTTGGPEYEDPQAQTYLQSARRPVKDIIPWCLSQQTRVIDYQLSVPVISARFLGTVKRLTPPINCGWYWRVAWLLGDRQTFHHQSHWLAIEWSLSGGGVTTGLVAHRNRCRLSDRILDNLHHSCVLRAQIFQILGAPLIFRHVLLLIVHCRLSVKCSRIYSLFDYNSQVITQFN